MPAHRKQKYENAVTLYNSGLSIQEVADYYGVSRQSMWDTLRRRNVSFRDKIKQGDRNRFFRGGKTSEKRTHHLVEKAIKKGLLFRCPCEICGLKPEIQNGRHTVEAHHDDYSKPLDVRWLCREHHYEWHKNNKAKPSKI